MRPTSLILRGITPYADTHADLSELPPGLVAVVGPNGSGKSTLMECLLPVPLFLEFPSQGGPLHERATRRDALIELRADYRGHTWRHVIQADPGTGRSGALVNAYLERDGAPLPEWPTPGRLRDYEAAVAAIFPPKPLILASTFSAGSGAGNFLEMSKAERRDLFTAMLGNEHLQALSTRAAKLRAPLDAGLGRILERIQDLGRDRTEVTELTRQRAELESGSAALEAQAERAREASAARAAALVAAEEGLARGHADREDALRRRQGLGGRLDRADFTIRSVEPTIAADERIVRAADEIRERAARATALIEERATVAGLYREARAKAGAARAERDRADHAYADAGDRARAAADHVSRLKSDQVSLAALEPSLLRLAELEEERPNRTKAIGAAKRSAIAKRTKLTERGRALDMSPEAAERRVADLERTAGLIGAVPCGGKRLDVTFGDGAEPSDGVIDCGACPLLSEARTARDALPRARAALEAARALSLELATLTADSEAAAAHVAELEEGLVSLDREIAQLRNTSLRAAELRAKVDGLPAALEAERAAAAALVAAELRRTEAAQASDAADSAQAAEEARGVELAAKIAKLANADRDLAELMAAETRLPLNRSALANARADLRAAEEEHASLPPVPSTMAAEVAVSAARQASEAAARVHNSSDRALADHRSRIDRLTGQIQAKGDLDARGREFEEGRATLDRARNAYRLVEKATGRDGVQALAIDGAGPRVSEITNRLLAATFGGRFAVALRTTRESADGKRQIECFDLEVLDGKAGGSRDVSRLSKGERVMVDEALKLGIGVFNAERNGADMETLYRDECDGALDEENAARYPRLLRAAREAGGFRNVYFVSHNPDVWSQADAVIRVTDGRIVVERS